MHKFRQRIAHGLVVGYVALWALVLPFICWGIWAEPGHGHAAPHFVFTAAPATTHGPHHHPDHDAPHDDADGVARPTTLVVTILVLVLGRGLLLLRPRLDHWPQPARSLLPLQHILPIPTPPPRPAAQV